MDIKTMLLGNHRPQSSLALRFTAGAVALDEVEDSMHMAWRVKL
jgi:hypothetical protein